MNKRRQCPLANLGININTLKFFNHFHFFKAEWCIEIHIFKKTLYHFQSFLKTHNTEMLKKFLYFLNIIDKFFSVLGALVICIDNQLFITVCIIMNSVSTFSSFSCFFLCLFGGKSKYVNNPLSASWIDKSANPIIDIT